MNRRVSRRGLVIYLTGAAEVGEEFDEEQALSDLGLDPDMTLLAASADNYYDVLFASKVLLERGAKRIEVTRASIDPAGRMHLQGDPMRLYG